MLRCRTRHGHRGACRVTGIADRASRICRTRAGRTTAARRTRPPTANRSRPTRSRQRYDLAAHAAITDAAAVAGAVYDQLAVAVPCRELVARSWLSPNTAGHVWLARLKCTSSHRCFDLSARANNAASTGGRGENTFDRPAQTASMVGMTVHGFPTAARRGYQHHHRPAPSVAFG